MKGTEKQVKWAEEIAAFRAWLDNKDSAAWWIDLWQMTKTARMFLRGAMAEYKK